MSRKDRAKQRKRAEQARINGARSKGPITPEGKRSSSLNSLRHGLAAKSVIVIEGESREALQEIIDAAWQSHQPGNVWEALLLDNAVSAAWRSRRAASFESALTNMQMQLDAPEVKKQFSIIDPITRQAISTRKLDQSPVSPRQLARYEAELSRTTQRWLQILQQAQSERRTNEAEAAEAASDAQLEMDSSPTEPVQPEAPSHSAPANEPAQPVTQTESTPSEPNRPPVAPPSPTSQGPAGPTSAPPRLRERWTLPL